jgi:cell wall-associated NlpC family hydrolase
MVMRPAAAGGTADQRLRRHHGAYHEIGHKRPVTKGGNKMQCSRLVGGLAAVAVLLTLIAAPTAVAAGTDLPPANPGAATIALSCLDAPFAPGGATRAGFDSPGLAKFVYACLGKWLPGTLPAQAALGVEVTRHQLRRGDLVFVGSDNHHVGVYTGGNKMVHAPGPGAVVKESIIDWSQGISLRRYDTRTGCHAALLAKRQLGVPYVFGGASLKGFDASGLTMYQYARLGVALPHGATDQQKQTKPVPLGKLRRGDLVFWGNAEYSYHVAIYMGCGRAISAPHAGAVVDYMSIKGAWIGGRLLPVR